MKKMKKFSALLLTAAMTLSMAACGNSSAGTSTTEAASNASEVLLKHRLTQHLQKLLKAQHPTVTLKISALSLTGIRMRCIPLSTLPLKKDTMRKKD